MERVTRIELAFSAWEAESTTSLTCGNSLQNRPETKLRPNEVWRAIGIANVRMIITDDRQRTVTVIFGEAVEQVAMVDDRRR